MTNPLDSARERLKRANENIRNLNAEIVPFLAPFPRITWKGGNPRFTDADQRAFDKLREHALQGEHLPRFSVLGGEIIHHLRCVFDHIVWELSSLDVRTKFGREIQFPVNISRPECIITPAGKIKHSSFAEK